MQHPGRSQVQTEEDADDEDDDVDDEPIAFLQLRKESKLRKPNSHNPAARGAQNQ